MQADADRLAIIRHSRELGFPLNSIQAPLALSDDPDRPCAQANVIACAHLAERRDRFGYLHRPASGVATPINTGSTWATTVRRRAEVSLKEARDGCGRRAAVGAVSGGIRRKKAFTTTLIRDAGIETPQGRRLLPIRPRADR